MPVLAEREDPHGRGVNAGTPHASPRGSEPDGVPALHVRTFPPARDSRPDAVHETVLTFSSAGIISLSISNHWQPWGTACALTACVLLFFFSLPRK